MKVLLVCGSRNRKGQTARAAEALLAGAGKAKATHEMVFLPELAVERCRQCRDDGWGTCRTEGSCVIADDFAAVSAKLAQADAVAFVTPVYFGDLSESMRAFTDRLRRICMHDATRKKFEGKRCVGMCVAGGGGGGAPNCCLSLERVLSRCGFDLVDMLSVRRQNLAAKTDSIAAAGTLLVS